MDKKKLPQNIPVFETAVVICVKLFERLLPADRAVHFQFQR